MAKNDDVLRARLLEQRDAFLLEQVAGKVKRAIEEDHRAGHLLSWGALARHVEESLTLPERAAVVRRCILMSLNDLAAHHAEPVQP